MRETAKSILQPFYNRPKNENHEDEKKAIIKAAAQLLKSDVQSLGEKGVYPTAKDIGSTEANLRYIPDSLKLFLRNLCGEKNNDLKGSSIGKAIMQLIRPRTLVSPLQIGHCVQLHHSFASRYLVSTLNNLGFCSSYSEGHRFESNAAVSLG